MPWLYSASALISCQFLFIDPMAMRPLLVLNRQLMRFELCFSVSVQTLLIPQWQA